jgi:hypothetical protein
MTAGVTDLSIAKETDLKKEETLDLIIRREELMVKAGTPTLMSILAPDGERKVQVPTSGAQICR